MKTFLLWLSSVWKHYDIKKKLDGEDVVYLRRFFIWRSKWFNIYLHNIILEDLDPDPHDHPWSFLSFVLCGEYVEKLWKNQTALLIGYKIRRVFSLAFRRGNQVHKIVEVLPNTWTLVITGPRYRSWGFVTAKGWVHWRKYLGLPAGPEDKDAKGSYID